MNSLPAIVRFLFSEFLVECLGWVLVHSLWQLAVVAILAGAALRAVQRSSATARYALLFFAMALAVGAPVATGAFLADRAFHARGGAPASNSQIGNGQMAESAFLAEPMVPRESAESIALEADRRAMDSAGSGGPRIVANNAPLELTWTERATLALRPYLAWIVAVWCTGVALCSLRPLLGWRTLRRLRRVGVSPASDELLGLLQRVSPRIGVRRAVRVMHSTLVQVPLVVGYLRPVILVPVGLATSVPAAQLEAILAHELAHVLRHDFVVNLLQTLVETVFFYHPAVWWLSLRMRIEREHCCDDLMIARLNNRVEYGRALLAVDELRGRGVLLALGVADGSLLARIRRVTGAASQGPTDLRERSPAALPSLACLGAVLVCSLTWSLAAKDRVDEPPRDAIAALPGDIVVELVGVGFHPSNDREWWKPDGSKLDERPEIQHRKSVMPNSPEQVKCREFAVQIRGLPHEHSVGADFGGVIAGGASSHHGGLWAGEFAAGPFRSAMTSIRLGISTEAFGPPASLDGEGKKLGYPELSKELRSLYEHVIPLRVEESDGMAELVLADAPLKDLNRRATWEIYAVGPEGQHKRASWNGSVSSEKHYWFNLKPDAIARFEYRVRPYRHWVTFENVSLQPGKKTRVVVKTESLPDPPRLRVKNADGSPAQFNNVVKATVGFPTAPLPRWVGWPTREGFVRLETLPEGAHWLLAAGDAEQRTVFPVKLPAEPLLIERRLRTAAAWTARNISLKPIVVNDDKGGELIVLEIANQIQAAFDVSEEDVQLQTESQGELIRGLSPLWLMAEKRPFPKITIEPGQTGQLTLNWADWVRQGLWSSRNSEAISEPALPAAVAGKLWIRVCLGNHGALPVPVTEPAAVLKKAEKGTTAAKFPPPAAETLRGLDLSNVPVRASAEALGTTPDLYVPDQADPGSWTSPKNLFQMPLAEHTWLKYPAGSGHFYIEDRPDGTWQTERLYGPIAGDPFELLKLEDFFRENLRSPVAAGDPTYRLRLMFRTADPALMRRAWRLIEPLLGRELPGRDQGLWQRIGLLQVAREALRDEADAFRNPALRVVLARMRQVVADTEAAIDELNDSLPDSAYQSVTYLQAKLEMKIPEALWGKPLDGLRLALVPLGGRLATSAAAHIGDELQYELIIENVSDREIRMCGYLGSEEVARTLEIVDRNGKRVDFQSVHTMILPHRSYWRLKPGERERFSFPAVHFIPPGEQSAERGLGYFVQAVPGEYTLRCSVSLGDLDNTRHRHVPGKSEWIGQLTTGTQKITVVDPNQ